FFCAAASTVSNAASCKSGYHDQIRARRGAAPCGVMRATPAMHRAEGSDSAAAPPEVVHPASCAIERCVSLVTRFSKATGGLRDRAIVLFSTQPAWLKRQKDCAIVAIGAVCPCSAYFSTHCTGERTLTVIFTRGRAQMQLHVWDACSRYG